MRPIPTRPHLRRRRPDGRAIIFSGICRACYRDPMGKPELRLPESPTRFRVDLWATSNTFRAGLRLRLRLEISSSVARH